jgi:Ataxin-3
MTSSESEYWIYHERQEALLCGQHALNNLVQASIFSAGSLADFAHQLDHMELNFMAQNNEGGVRSKEYIARLAEGSGNVDPSGNFSIEVLRAALRGKYDLDLPNIGQEGVGDSIDVAEMEGFICNRSSHWFAIRKINGRFWNLNSTQERPIAISHFNLATEIQGLQNSGYSVFCVPLGLPPICSSETQRSRGLPQYWWKESDLVQGKGSNATTGASDPWKNVGSGLRLDGRSTMDMQELTEDEMMQVALEASLMAPAVQEETVPLTAEPAAGTEGVVRLQFRLPNGGRKVRRFLKDNSVKMLYTYVGTESNDGQGRLLELRFGFPPKDLAGLRNKTIGEASLDGEAIQGRFV